MNFDCQLNGMFPIVDRESASNIVLVQQAFVVCNALRSEEYSYEKFMEEYKLLSSMVVKVLKTRDEEGYSDDLSYLEQGSDMFSRVYQTYLWARSIIEICGLSEEDFLKEISKLCTKFESDDLERVHCFVVTFSDILSLLKKKYIHFEGIDVIEEYISGWIMLFD